MTHAGIWDGALHGLPGAQLPLRNCGLPWREVLLETVNQDLGRLIMKSICNSLSTLSQAMAFSYASLSANYLCIGFSM